MLKRFLVSLALLCAMVSPSEAQRRPGRVYGYNTGLTLFGAVANQLPQQAAIVTRLRADTGLGTLTDGAKVTSWADTLTSSGVSVTQGTVANQPTFKANSYNNHPGVTCNGTSTVLTGASTAANNAWTNGEVSMLVVYANVQASSFGFMASLTSSTGFNVSNNGTYVGGGVPATNGVGGAPTTFGTAMYTIGATSYNYSTLNQIRAPIFANGQVVGALSAKPGSLTQLGICATSTGVGYAKADILDVIIWNRRLTAYEGVQAEMALRDYYGAPYPWASTSYVYEAIGDSLTAGYGTSDSGWRTAYPYLVAQQNSLPVGTYANHGYIGSNPIQIKAIVDGERIKDISTLINKTVKFSYFEWYNQRGNATSPIASSAAVSNTQALLADIKAVSGNKVALGTSTDAGNAAGGSPAARVSTRSDYNNYWCNTAGTLTGYADVCVAIHTDSNIGVEGAAADTYPLSHYFNAYLLNGYLTGASGASGATSITATGTGGSYAPAVGSWFSGTGFAVDTVVTGISGSGTVTYTLSKALTATISATPIYYRGDAIHYNDFGHTSIAPTWATAIANM